MKVNFQKAVKKEPMFRIIGNVILIYGMRWEIVWHKGKSSKF